MGVGLDVIHFDLIVVLMTVLGQFTLLNINITVGAWPNCYQGSSVVILLNHIQHILAAPWLCPSLI